MEQNNPYQEQYRQYKAGVNILEKVSEERYYEMLEVLPPARRAGMAFLVGEPVIHNDAGRPLFDFYFSSKGEYFFGGLLSTRDFDQRFSVKCYSDHNEDIRTKGNCDYCSSADVQS